MKLTILGTGNATVTECYNTCFALSDGNRHFLVDTGGGNRILKVLKDTGIQLEDIHDIFITHEHIDHLLGVIWLIRMIGQKKIGQGKYEGNLRIYCHEELARSIRMTGFFLCRCITERQRKSLAVRSPFSIFFPRRQSSSDLRCCFRTE